MNCKICDTHINRKIQVIDNEIIEIQYYCENDDYGKVYIAHADEIEPYANEEEYGI